MEYFPFEQIRNKCIFTALLLELIYWSSATSTDNQLLCCCIITVFNGDRAPEDAEIKY